MWRLRGIYAKLCGPLQDKSDPVASVECRSTCSFWSLLFLRSACLDALLCVWVRIMSTAVARPGARLALLLRDDASRWSQRRRRNGSGRVSWLVHLRCSPHSAILLPFLCTPQCASMRHSPLQLRISIFFWASIVCTRESEGIVRAQCCTASGQFSPLHCCNLKLRLRCQRAGGGRRGPELPPPQHPLPRAVLPAAVAFGPV